MSLDDFKIIKKLGQGMIGTVYLIESRGSNYAYKIEHILKKDTIKSKTSKLYREISFCKFIKKYPNQFIQLIDYDIIGDCGHFQAYKVDPGGFSKEKQKEFSDLAKSKYCVRKIFTLVDGNLEDILNKLTVKQIYSMIIQLVTMVTIMHSHGWVHGDFHPLNIGYIKTPEGYTYKAIDYGEVKNNKYLAKNERKVFNEDMKYEIGNIKYILTESKSWKYLRTHKIKPPGFVEHYNLCKNTPEFNDISVIKDKYNRMFLFELLHPRVYQKFLLGKHFTKLMPMKCLIPREDIMFFVKNSDDPRGLIKYFTKKLNE
jgi:serine/threonine protein kinase